MMTSWWGFFFQDAFNWYWIALYTCILLRVVSINLIWLCYMATKISLSELLLLPFSSSCSSGLVRLSCWCFIEGFWMQQRGEEELRSMRCCCHCPHAGAAACFLAQREAGLGAVGDRRLKPLLAAARFQIRAPWKWQWPRYRNSVTFVIASPPRGRLTSGRGGTRCLARKL